MTDKKALSDKQLDILHDHYKETFARMRDVEARRDQLFLWLIGLFVLLSLEIGYPAAVGGALGKLSIAGGELNLQALPLAALLSATWVLTVTIGLRYCQTTILVNRQYPYLHMLEETLSPALGGGDLYQREGKVYLREYPLLLDASWFAYSIMFPFIVMFAALSLAIWEYGKLSYPLYHKVFDWLMSIALICFYFVYRVQPTLSSKWRKRQQKKIDSRRAQLLEDLLNKEASKNK